MRMTIINTQKITTAVEDVEKSQHLQTVAGNLPTAVADSSAVPWGGKNYHVTAIPPQRD